MGAVSLRSPISTLASYCYFRDADMSTLAEHTLMVADSSAFLVKALGYIVDIDELTEWIKKHRQSLFWAAALDVIGDEEKTWRSYRYMRDRGVDAVPTLHFPAQPQALDRYAADGVDFVGLGGAVRVPFRTAMRWCVSIFRYARDRYPQMRFHGWATTSTRILESFPWYSVDSSTTTIGARYGNIRLYSPTTRKNINFNAGSRKIYRHSDMLREHYGLTAREIMDAHRARNGNFITLVSVKGTQLWEDVLRRHPVPAPTYGIAPEKRIPGVHIHHVGPDHRSLTRLVNAVLAPTPAPGPPTGPNQQGD